MLCSLTQPTKVPYFNAPIYLQNKTQIGKIDEILGPINEVYFTVKMEQGMLASSFKKDDKVYIGGDKLLPIERFLPKPKVPGGEAKSECPCLSSTGVRQYGKVRLTDSHWLWWTDYHRRWWMGQLDHCAASLAAHHVPRGHYGRLSSGCDQSGRRRRPASLNRGRTITRLAQAHPGEIPHRSRSYN